MAGKNAGAASPSVVEFSDLYSGLKRARQLQEEPESVVESFQGRVI
jgi:hypothetical protein